MPRRGENIYKRKDGRWEGRIKKTVCLPNERKYKSVYGKSYREVRAKMEAARKELEENGEQCIFSMAEAAEMWMKDKGYGWKTTTYASYLQIVDKYIVPCLGTLPLYRIDNQRMEMFISEIQQKDDKRKLSSNYLFYICGIVQRIMIHIRKKNNFNLTVPEIPVSKERKTKMILPSTAALSKLEDYLVKNTENDTCVGILTALHTGIRIGELCALTWKDVDFDEGVLHIRKSLQRIKCSDGQKNKTKMILSTPKTVDSIRDIPIPPILLPVLLSCRKHPDEPVIGGVKSLWIEPRTLQYRFKRILKECDLEYFNFHMLRHAFATRCIEKGFDIKSLSEILGHSNIQITLNLYVHSSLKQKKQLMSMLGSISEENFAAAG